MRLVEGGFDHNELTGETRDVDASRERVDRDAWQGATRGLDVVLFAPLEIEQLRDRVIRRIFAGDGEPMRVGRYHVLERLGAGAMGVVFAAYDNELDRKIAVKLWRPSGASPAEARARMLREAKALARLSHPNVVQVHDAGEWQGEVFVAMELVPGTTLRVWLAQRRRSAREILERFVEAGAGLAAAHTAGIVHRDFKPDNVIVGADGRVRVVDFGLALARAASPERELASAAMGELGAAATATGVVLGTPAYMAPEQLAGDDLDPRADQFAFAVALFEALHGRRPFAGDTLGEIATAIEAGPRPGSRRGSPRRVGLALRRALAADPAERFPSMPALLTELRPRLSRWLAVAFVTTAMLIAAGVAWLAAQQGTARRRDAIASAIAGERARLDAIAQRDAERRKYRDAIVAQARRELERDPTRTAALLADLPKRDWDEEATSLGSEALARGVASRVRPLPRHAIPLGLANDGSLVLSLPEESERNPLIDDRGGAIWTFAGEPKRLGAGVPVVAARFTSVFTTSRDGTLRVHGFAGQSRDLADLGVEPDAVFVDRLATAAAVVQGDHVTVFSMEGLQHSPRAISRLDATSPFVLGPAGKTAVFVDGEGRLRVHDFEAAETRTVARGMLGQLGLSADGERVLARATDETLGVWSVADGARVLKADGVDRAGPRLSPDGRWFAVWRPSAGACGPDLVRIDEPEVFSLCSDVHFGAQSRLVFSSGSSRLAALDTNGVLEVWDLADRARISIPTSDPISFVAFVDEDTIVTGSTDEMREWALPFSGWAPLPATDAGTPLELAFGGPSDLVGILRPPPARRRSDPAPPPTLLRWDLEGGGATKVADASPTHSHRLATCKGGWTAIATDTELQVYDDQDRRRATLPAASRVMTLALAPDCSGLFWALEPATVLRLDLRAGDAAPEPVACAACDEPDARVIAIAVGKRGARLLLQGSDDAAVVDVAPEDGESISVPASMQHFGADGSLVLGCDRASGSAGRFFAIDLAMGRHHETSAHEPGCWGPIRAQPGLVVYRDLGRGVVAWDLARDSHRVLLGPNVLGPFAFEITPDGESLVFAMPGGARRIPLRGPDPRGEIERLRGAIAFAEAPTTGEGP